jgi:hypothetical protein
LIDRDYCKDRVSGQPSFYEISFGSFVLFIFTKLTMQSLFFIRIVKRGHLLLPIFRPPYKKEKKQKKKSKNFWKKENKKICSSEKRCWSVK